MNDLTVTNDTQMSNITHGSVSFYQMVKNIVEYINQEPDAQYQISIGSDSQTYSETRFVLAIVIHRLSKGGIFYYKKFEHKKVSNLRNKLYDETQLSLDAANLLLEGFNEMNFKLNNNVSFHVHVDIGEHGKTKELISEITGWVTALGFEVDIKPESYAASSIADKYSK